MIVMPMNCLHIYIYIYIYISIQIHEVDIVYSGEPITHIFTGSQSNLTFDQFGVYSVWMSKR
jgi:hypothetical protein